MWSAAVIYWVLLVLVMDLGDAPPVPKKFIVHSSDLAPHEGETLTLSCLLDGPHESSVSTPVSYEWIKDGKVIPGQTERILTLQKLSVQNEGNYQCGPPDINVVKEDFHLNVICVSGVANRTRRGVSMSDGALTHETFYVDEYGSNLEGRPLRLRCYHYGPPSTDLTATFIWFKNGEILPGKTQQDVTFERLAKEDKGDYMCGIQDSHVPRKSHHLQVLSNLPQPTIVEDRLPVCGQRSSIECTILKGYRKTDTMVYIWYKDSTEIKGQSDQVLWFDNVTEADEGKYTCTVRDGPENTTSPHSPSFDLTPLVTPKITIKPTTPDSVVKGILGDSLTLTCEVIRAIPRVPVNGYTWNYLSSMHEPLRPLSSKTKTLTLNSLRKEHSGQYTCQARNDQHFTKVVLVGKASVTVDIVYLENIHLTPAMEADEGDRVTLTCRVDSHPQAHLTWFTDGHDLRQVVDNLDHFVIPKVSCADSRNYTCHASNADMPGRDINATTQLLVQCNNNKDKSPIRQQIKITQADVSALFNFTLPEQTAIEVFHPNGQGIITVYKNCSYIVSPAFLPRCVHPHCDSSRRNFRFILSQITELDEGRYFCMEVGQPPKPLPMCEERFIFKKVMSNTPHQKMEIWIAIGTTLPFLVVIAVAALIIFLRKRDISRATNHFTSKHKSAVCPLASWLLPSTDSSMKEGSKNFGTFYENGKVYMFPTPSNLQERDIADDESEGEVKVSLLSLNEVKDTFFSVKDLIRCTLQKFTGTDDLPSFCLFNTRLSRQENVCLVLSRKLGVVVMLAKAVSDSKYSLVIKEALRNLVDARNVITKKLKGLVRPEEIKAAIILPNLSEIDNTCGKVFQSFPDVDIMLGQKKEDYEQWARSLSRRPDAETWDLSSAEVGSPDSAFKMAASRILTLVGGSHPDKSPRYPTAAETWLLTPEQMEVRDNTSNLLHIWGPHGAGKTMLMINRARQWLAEGKTLVLAIGKETYSLLLAHIAASVNREQDKKTSSKIRVCRTFTAVQEAVKDLKRLYPNMETCIIVDTLRDTEMFKCMLWAAEFKQAAAVWSVCRSDLKDIDEKLSEKANKYDWKSIRLPLCIRCTKNTVELLNLSVEGSPIHDRVTPCNIPRTQDMIEWFVVDHCLHQNHNCAYSCIECKKELSNALSATKQSGTWNDWIAIYSGDPNVRTDIRPLCSLLQSFDVPASHDNYDDIVPDNSSRYYASDSDFTERTRPIAASVDEKGNQTIPLVQIKHIIGLEKDGVLLVHCDDRDTNDTLQSREERDQRLAEHRRLWVQAVSRSKGRVVLCLLTPSPARSLLNLPEPLPGHR